MQMWRYTMFLQVAVILERRAEIVLVDSKVMASTAMTDTL